jgi:hypothetical protein
MKRASKLQLHTPAFAAGVWPLFYNTSSTVYTIGSDRFTIKELEVVFSALRQFDDSKSKGRIPVH